MKQKGELAAYKPLPDTDTQDTYATNTYKDSDKQMPHTYTHNRETNMHYTKRYYTYTPQTYRYYTHKHYAYRHYRDTAHVCIHRHRMLHKKQNCIILKRKANPTNQP